MLQLKHQKYKKFIVINNFNTLRANMSSTIVAIATATAVSSISIVRVSGDRALEIAKKIVKQDDISPRYAHLFSLYNREGSLIDQAVVNIF